MRYKILLYGLMAAAITSCSSVYKASQTPDDVYYSPAKEGVQKQTAKQDRYEDYVSSEEDQYLRMKIRDRQRWSGIDDYSYWNDSRYVPSYNYNYDYYRNNMYNSYMWNNWGSPYSSLYFNPYYGSGLGLGLGFSGYYPQYGYGGYGYGYNPYGSSYISKNPTRAASPSVNRPNLNTYRNGLYNNRNYNNSNTNNNNQGFGNTLRRVFAPSDNIGSYNTRNSNTNTYSAPQRSYSPSSSGGGSSSVGSSSGGGGVSRPPR